MDWKTLLKATISLVKPLSESIKWMEKHIEGLTIVKKNTRLYIIIKIDSEENTQQALPYLADFLELITSRKPNIVVRDQ